MSASAGKTISGQSKHERRRAWQKGHNRSCVLKVVNQALYPTITATTAEQLATTSADVASAAVPQTTPSAAAGAGAATTTTTTTTTTVVMSDAALEALVACHWAFVAEATAGMAENYRNNGHEVYSDDNDNDSDDDNGNKTTKRSKTKNKKKKTGFNGITKSCLAVKLQDLDCTDLWNQALLLNNNETAQKTQVKKKRGGGGGGLGDTNKTRRNKAIMDFKLLQAEQERLLETSRRTALLQQQQAQTQKQPPTLGP